MFSQTKALEPDLGITLMPRGAIRLIVSRQVVHTSWAVRKGMIFFRSVNNRHE
jgi:hypothetical protein